MIDLKVIRSINNNVAICVDGKGNEVVAFGKGIGFIKGPHDVELSKIERTYYDINEQYLSMMNDIPADIIQISDMILTYAQTKLDNLYNPNLIITLADHINFSIKRYQEQMEITLPIVKDIQFLFKNEMEIGKYGVELIHKKKHLTLPEEEAAYIALHIINAEGKAKNKKDISNKMIIEDITRIIEEYFKIQLDKEGFNYTRFVSHINYLLKRGKEKKMLKTANKQIYDTLVSSYQNTFDCTRLISDYLAKKINIALNDEEKMYLIIHINRLCIREDCYQ